MMNSHHRRRPWGIRCDWWLAGGATDVWAAYQPKNCASESKSILDISGQSHNAGIGTMPSWIRRYGWIFNASQSQYLTTNFVPESDKSQSMVLYFTNLTSAMHGLAGLMDPTNGYFGIGQFVTWPVVKTAYYMNGYADTWTDATSPSAVVAIAGNKAYRNGVDTGITLGNWAGATSLPLFIGAFNENGTANYFANCCIAAMSLYTGVLSAYQVAEISREVLTI